MSHAASAFYPSPFAEAIILTADGVGEWGTTTVAIGKENKLEIPQKFKSLTRSKKLKIGLAWSGRPTHIRDLNRNIKIHSNFLSILQFPLH